ncbi:MAG TPA: helix-turn-helix domain-containing protein [Candidatus Ornithomonoglobus intestinigallinarum]|uniref:Helix-turn-helix domain-containing protein n=1 Tax=Candidatus Ornithomonoglobus intestinigallinarum TaxID=2840894 RepID=A0A9D1H0H8_9FIRM|nr:helix-turn-helix domain-containing protein [Candidatus Ornithomonoglobus intestinigallinarum]
MKFENEFGFKEDIYDYVGTTDNQILHALSGITYPDPKYKMLRRNALCYSFEYVYEGEGEIQENKEIHKVSAGDFFILHPNCYHHYHADPNNPWKKIFLMIDGGIALPAVMLKQYNTDSITYFPQLCDPLMLEDIFELFKSNNSNISQKFETLLCSMIIKLAHLSKRTVSDFSSINTAKKFIDKKINAKLTLDEIAKYANISVSFLCREFKKTFGVTPYTYILNSKIEFAKTMLLETDITVQVISERFSFSDVAHFSKAFSKIVGMPPTAFREMYGGNKGGAL